MTVGKRALVTGITGQDGSYLAELLLRQGYEVHGLVRRVSTENFWRLSGVRSKLHLHEGDLTERGGMERLVKGVSPDVVFNLAAQSHVMTSFEVPEYSLEVDAMSVVRLLEAIRNSSRKIRLYHASSSEMFGTSPPPQNEATPFQPRSPYAVAKLAAHSMCGLYRYAYGLHVSCGILHNHESPRRGENFVTRKIAIGVARVKAGLQDKIALGNFEAERDWGHAADYVRAMLMMVEADAPGDYVIATGESHTVREFVVEAFRVVGISDWQSHVGFDEKFVRPAEVPALRGDASRAREVLGWVPQIKFADLVREMVEAEQARLPS